MTLKTLTALGLTSLATLPVAAFAAVTVGDVIGATEAEIRAKLESEGYVITEIEIEGDEIEVEATYDGKEVEIELAKKTGAIVEIETDEDDD